MTYPASVLARTPTAYWRLGESSGTVAADLTGNGHDGTYSAGWTLGSTGLLASDAGTSALSNGGGSTRIVVPAGTWFDLGTGDFTILGWLKTTSTGVNGVFLGNIGTNATWLGVDPSGHLTFSNGASTGTGAAVVNDGVAHQIAATRTAGVVQIYRDGATDGATHSGGDFATAAGNAVTATGIGNFDSNTFPLVGNFQEVQVYKGVALSGATIAADFATGGTPPPTTTTIHVNDANLFLSPYNWLLTGSASAESVNPGAYFKLGVSGTTTIGLAVDVSGLVGATVAAKKYPWIRWKIDEGPYTTRQLVSGDATVSLATGLTTGTHQLFVQFLASDAYTARWTGLMGLKFTGVIVGASGVSVAPTLRSGGYVITFGDSITEGAWCLGGPADLTNYSDNEDASAAYTAGITEALNCEHGRCAFGGQAWDSGNVFNADIPGFVDAWPFIFGTNSRLTGGLLTPAPNYVINDMGANGGVASSATVTAWLGAIRAAAGPTAKILQIIPFGGGGRANITAGVAAYKTAHPTDPTYLIDLGTVPELAAASGAATSGSFDGLHPDVPTHGRMGAMVARAIQLALGGGTGGRRPAPRNTGV